MRITDLLKKQSIALSVSVKDKSEAIDTLVDLHTRSGNLKDAAVYKEGILAREQMGTTAIGMEVAIPHAKSEAVKAPALSAITVPNGVDYGAPDGQPCKLIFMIAATLDGDVHLEVLARLMQMLMHEDFTAKLKAAKTANEFLQIIDEQETAQFPEEAAAPAAPKKEGYRVLAVTACPTGIAHTYMAAESLAKAGEKMGITIKVETNGSGGAKNVLTAEEIANCDGIIIAADKNVETARFNGKPVYSTKVADGIHKPEELINKIVNGEAPVFHSDKKVEASAGGGNESFGRQLYKHLMNGVSHMLPFVVAGGIFIAIAFLIDTFAGNAGSADFGSVNQVAAWFKTIGGVAFNLMVPILAGFIAMSIADRPGLLVGLVGGFLATAGATFPLPGGDIPSGFLGGLLAGFVGGYMMLGIEKMCSKFPRALEGIKPVLVYPLLGLGGVAVLMCAINPIMGWINTGMTNVLKSMADSGLIIPLCALLAGMMAIDMGGPFNKAAYVFATGMLASQTDAAYMIMAAVMIGGMVPPIAIALSTTFFKSRWTDEERRNAPVNYIMGLSFITEGAIPYAAGHPLQVIPSCIVGSAAAGALSAIFQCKLMAPHGGVFVFATMQGTWMFYILALLIGAVLGMIMLAILKKPVNKEK
ncbi:MAG: fructose-specific PTS transporter subunit EIIC [Ruminococcus sp.]|nr:fructose-specific PTS transporter subunit EIIC [Ruminococcus sp.]